VPAAAVPPDKDEPAVRLYQRQTWRELAERSRPPSGRLTRWRLLVGKPVRVVWAGGVRRRITNIRWGGGGTFGSRSARNGRARKEAKGTNGEETKVVVKW